MAKSNRNVVTHNLSGKIGDLLIFSQRFGKTIVGKVPNKKAAATDKQQAFRERFRKAISYATAILKNPEMKALYLLKAGEGITAFNLAVGDYFTPPVIAEIITTAYTGAVGSELEILATDDTKVVTVKCSIVSGTGQAVEEGQAVEDPDTGRWLYKATVLNASIPGTKITVVATDIPGNAATEVKLL